MAFSALWSFLKHNKPNERLKHEVKKIIIKDKMAYLIRILNGNSVKHKKKL